MINYGTHTTIKLGCKVVKEYSDIANVEPYDAILGTPFLRKMGIVLDFRSPGMSPIGNEVIPTGKVFFDESKDTENNIAAKDTENNIAAKAILYRAAALLWTGNEARRVDHRRAHHRRAHPKVPPAGARGSVLILG